MEIFSMEYVKGYFIRNKILLFISLSIFIFLFLSGVLVSFIFNWGHHGFISAGIFMGKVNMPLNKLFVDTLELFAHNFTIDLATLLLGLLFSIFSIISVGFNAFLIGMPFGQDFLFAFFSIVPHGIFEYTASIFSLVGAFLITIVEVEIIKSFWDKNKSIRDVISENNDKLKDILLSALFMTVLLIIAAIIEGEITPRIVAWVFGLS